MIHVITGDCVERMVALVKDTKDNYRMRMRIEPSGDWPDIHELQREELAKAKSEKASVLLYGFPKDIEQMLMGEIGQVDCVYHVGAEETKTVTGAEWETLPFCD